jgi:hypothetical protein
MFAGGPLKVGPKWELGYWWYVDPRFCFITCKYCSCIAVALAAATTWLLATIPGPPAGPRLPAIREPLPGPELIPGNAGFPIFAPPSAIPLTTSTLKPLLAIIMVPGCIPEDPNTAPGCKERIGCCCCRTAFRLKTSMKVAAAIISLSLSLAAEIVVAPKAPSPTPRPTPSAIAELIGDPGTEGTWAALPLLP